MENKIDFSKGIYEVEKIINYKIYKNRKYYLIKWLSYPIHASTWEPKSNLKNLDNLIVRFENEYPYSIDLVMYKAYCEQTKKRTKTSKNGKMYKNNKTNDIFLSKKKKMEFFSSSELKERYLYNLKIHLHLNLDERYLTSKEGELIIDLSSSKSEILLNTEEISNNSDKIEEKLIISQLIKPEME